MAAALRTISARAEATMSVRVPAAANAYARFIATVVFPTPPFWLTTAREIGLSNTGLIAESAGGKHKKLSQPDELTRTRHEWTLPL